MLKDDIQKALAPLNLEQVAEGDYAKTGYHLDVTAAPGQMPEVAQAMLNLGCFLESLTGLHYPEHFTLVYHFGNFRELCRTGRARQGAPGPGGREHQPHLPRGQLV